MPVAAMAVVVPVTMAVAGLRPGGAADGGDADDGEDAEAEEGADAERDHGAGPLRLDGVSRAGP